uniref:START domain-containing protein n=1 Tax=Amphimedon queenslandica TaxID=400682 RepID=A0A1X7SVF7_AMPQE
MDGSEWQWTCHYMFQGIEKDVIVILKKKKVSESPFHSFIGKGLIDLSPQEVYNCVRNPNQRYIFDNMLKELHVVKQIDSDLYILHMQHETTQCFLRQSRDFCILVCERSEPNKKIIVGASVEVPECPPQPSCTRGKVMTSGWVIEPYRYKEKLLTQVTYLVQ